MVGAIVASDGKIVSIVTVFLLVTSTLAVLTRLLTKRAVLGKANVDDGIAIMALICHIGCGVAVAVLDANGLGSYDGELQGTQKVRFAKSVFAAELLFIATLCFAKLSIILFLNLITRQRLHRLLGYSLGAFITVWSAIEFIAAAFTCKVPATWNIFGSKCFDRAAFWYVFGVINILTDIALVVLPSYIVLPLQMSTAKKWTVMSCFGARLLDVAATVSQFVFTDRYHDSEFTESIWPWILIAQIMQCLSIVTSCVPYLRPLVESLPSGMFMSDELRRRGTTLASREGYIRTTDHTHVLKTIRRPA